MAGRYGLVLEWCRIGALFAMGAAMCPRAFTSARAPALMLNRIRVGHAAAQESYGDNQPKGFMFKEIPNETIAHAAIQHPSGRVFTGKRHCYIIRDMVAELGERPARGIQGFTTNTGRFVDREEAGRIAIAAGQIKELRYSRTDLFSEELW